VVLATEKSLRNPALPQMIGTDLTVVELAAITSSLADLKAAIGNGTRAVIEEKTAALNEATKHLAEVQMNRGVRAALSGRNVDEL
jgi:hypothetical protein